MPAPPPTPATAPIEDAPVFEPTPAERASPPDGRIGVVAHLFYADLAGELAAYLANVPWPFTVLASTCREADRREVERVLAAVPRVERLDVRAVPNRGRDIAPMLVEFAEEVRGLDLVCHVHGKKSLQTGAAQDGWRRHLHDALLGSEARVRAILAQFRRDPRVGIVYPGASPQVAYLSLTWGANRAMARSLLPRLGAELDEATYLEFPAGSMFWARAAALAPLLDLRLRLEDFPPERGQIDGTLQHAIERSFVLAARARGFSARVLAEGSARHAFLASNHRNVHRYLAHRVGERIAAAAAGADVVAVDVLGTLLAHRCGVPATVHDVAALRAREVEGAAAPERMERDALRALLRPRNEVVAAVRALREAGKRVVLVADGPLGARALRPLLAAHGIDFHDALYAAADQGLTKESGALFEEVLRCEGVEPERLTVIGDDEHGDVAVVMGRRLGRPVHVMRPLALLDLAPEGRALLGEARPRRWQDDLWIGMVALRAALRADADPAAVGERRLLADPEDLGYAALGPFLLRVLGWLAREAVRDGVRHLEFLGPEGWLLHAAYERLAARAGGRRELPPAERLAMARSLAHAATSSSGSAGDARRAWSAYLARRARPGAAVVALGRSVPLVRTLCALAGAGVRTYYLTQPIGVDATGPWSGPVGPPLSAPAVRAVETLLASPDGDLAALRGPPGAPHPAFAPRATRFDVAGRVHAGAHAFLADLAEALGQDALDLDPDAALVDRALRLVAEGRWGGPEVRALVDAASGGPADASGAHGDGPPSTSSER